MISFFLTLVRFFRSIYRGAKDPDFRGLLIFVIVILITGTVFYHQTEHWGWLNSFYFSAVTLTTVGYGDLVPKTDLGKIFTVIYLFVGIGAILGFINAVAQHAQDESKKKP